MSVVSLECRDPPRRDCAMSSPRTTSTTTSTAITTGDSDPDHRPDGFPAKDRCARQPRRTGERACGGVRGVRAAVEGVRASPIRCQREPRQREALARWWCCVPAAVVRPGGGGGRSVRSSRRGSHAAAEEDRLPAAQKRPVAVGAIRSEGPPEAVARAARRPEVAYEQVAAAKRASRALARASISDASARRLSKGSVAARSRSDSGIGVACSRSLVATLAGLSVATAEPPSSYRRPLLRLLHRVPRASSPRCARAAALRAIRR